jgi:methyl-accepting chemotaxis protein
MIDRRKAGENMSPRERIGLIPQGLYIKVVLMKIGRMLLCSAALLAAASAAASLAGGTEALPAVLAIVAAAAATIAAFRSPVSPPGERSIAADLPAAPAFDRMAEESDRERADDDLRKLSAEHAAEGDAAHRMGASALRRLRFADSVLRKVPVKTEEAAFALMGRLVSLRDQSAKAAEAALASDEKVNDQDEIATLAGEALSTIASVRTALSEMRRHDRDAAKGLQTLGVEIKSGIELLAGIEEITERSRIIAFNMAIEAARIGEKGGGFKVIVGELRALNDRTADFSKQVAKLLGGFKKYNESLIQSAIDSSSRVAEEVERGIGKEEKTIESLLRASSTCVDLSDSVMRAMQSMNLELDGVLESLQFQDITRQMVEGALVTIAEAEGDIAPIARVDSSVAASEDERLSVEALRGELLSRAKTNGEKEAIKEVSA